MRRKAALVVLAAGLMSGCASDDGTEGDCSARVRYEGALYRSHNLLPERAATDAVVGEGDIVGCGGLDAAAVDSVDVRRLTGVSPEVAVGLRGEWQGIFIREDLASEVSAWPAPIRP